MCSNTRVVLRQVIAIMFGVLLSFWAIHAIAVGFKEMSSNGVNFGVWYPSQSQPSITRLGPFELEVAKDAPISMGEHEIILFSHGNSGYYRNHYLTFQALADAGFIVIAPQHEADYLVGGGKTAAALNNRYGELNEALNAVLDAP